MPTTPRARFPGGIVAEFTPPARRGREDDIVIICGGLPSMPDKRELSELFSRNGLWAFAMRYRGTWESDGKFLKESPEEDVKLLLQGISRGFRDAYSGKPYKLKLGKICVFGSSFGGPAAFFMSKDPRITRTVALSPVTDWREQHETEPPKWFLKYIQEGFGPAYRMDVQNWHRMMAGKFYNPAIAPERIDGSKVLIIHAKDDRLVRWRPVAKFAKEIEAKLILTARGGHGSSALTPGLKRRIINYLVR